MWLSIIGLLFGQLPSIVQQISQARIALAQSKTEEERIAAEERIKLLEDRRDFLISNSRWAMYLIAAILAPFVIYLWWIIGWDKIACKWFAFDVATTCKTDPLSPWLEGTFASILALLTLKKA